MSYASQMLETHPWQGNVDRAQLVACIDACIECEQACTSCADACLSESGPEHLTKCIRLNLDCADVCGVTARVITRQTGYDAPTTKSVLESCAEICATCAEECEHHAGDHEHCRICADACRRCEEACRSLLDAMK